MSRHSLFCVSIFVMLCLSLLNPVAGFSEVEKKSGEVKKVELNPLVKVVEQTLGKGVKIIRTEAPENSPIPHWKQTRVWIASIYGETPVLFYSTEDGKFIFAGSLFDASAENLTRKDVGKTIPKFIENAKMELNEDYRIGNKEATVKAVLWIGADPYSKELFQTFYDLYNNNKDKVALYIKFHPRSQSEKEKMNALTCFKGAALVNALKVIYDASPLWGSKEDIDAFKKTGDLSACNNELILKDLNLAATLKLPNHPVAFVNGTMLIEKASKENIMKLAGTKLD